LRGVGPDDLAEQLGDAGLGEGDPGGDQPDPDLAARRPGDTPAADADQFGRRLALVAAVGVEAAAAAAATLRAITQENRRQLRVLGKRARWRSPGRGTRQAEGSHAAGEASAGEPGSERLGTSIETGSIHDTTSSGGNE
jgi:hypothetical protein